ncbi:ferritin-like domain-containing protein [Pararhizobium mangrovi]|uniref:Ferritin-like domain-containing protein n=1 Tax=Pararhizobium mangrovi TaxID=2590452 RepID=A0A506U369_9HYPH|nr:ferritin-like domain-containing protein [Pararhizobium mangrovi]TPW27445.1 ferritin-like domain-containing protein [Pararhizobium mangrovi]
MAITSLKDVYIDQMQDIYSADTQSKDVMPELAKAAKSDELRQAIEKSIKGIESGMETLSKILKGHDADPSDEFCKGMEGLVKEARAHGLDEKIEDGDARDAMIITQVQRMGHYAIAGYGCCAAFAERLGLEDEARMLRECLDGTRDGDKKMTEIAKSTVNPAAS